MESPVEDISHLVFVMPASGSESPIEDRPTLCLLPAAGIPRQIVPRDDLNEHKTRRLVEHLLKGTVQTANRAGAASTKAASAFGGKLTTVDGCLLYTSPSPRD